MDGIETVVAVVQVCESINTYRLKVVSATIVTVNSVLMVIKYSMKFSFVL